MDRRRVSRKLLTGIAVNLGLLLSTACSSNRTPDVEPLRRATFEYVYERAPWLLPLHTPTPDFEDAGDHWRASVMTWLHGGAELIVEIPKETNRVSRAYVTIPLEGEENVRHIKEVVRLSKEEDDRTVRPMTEVSRESRSSR